MASRSKRTNVVAGQTESPKGQSARAQPPATGKNSERSTGAWQYALLLGAILLVFGQVVTFDFAPIDDMALVTANPLYRPLTLEHLWQPWREPVWHLYMPLTFTFYAVEVAISNMFSAPAQNEFLPSVFHIGNLLLHCVSASLVMMIARMLTGSARAALLAALFFALHPLQAESVAWISETKGMLCNCFCLAGLALQVFRIRSEESFSQTARRVLWGGMNMAFVLALLAKPSAIAVLPVSWIIAVGFLQRSALISALELAPSALVAAIISVVAKRAQGDELLTFIPPAVMRPLIAGDTIAFYLGKLVLPFGLTVDYGRTPESILSTSWIWFAWLVPVGVAVSLGLLPHRKVWLWTLAIFVVCLAPVSGLVSFLFQYYSTVSDRYVYLAMLGPSLAVAWFFSFYARPQLVAGFGVLLVGMGLLCARQAATWKSTEALYARARSVNAECYLAERVIGFHYADAGKTEEAIEHMSRAAELKPDAFAVRLRLGAVLVEAGRLQEAISRFQDAVRLKPDFADGHNDLGVAFGKAGQLPEAIGEFQQAIRLKPDDLEFRTHLMIAFAKANHPNEAITTAEAAIQLARESGNAQRALDIEGWLQNYRAAQPQR